MLMHFLFIKYQHITKKRNKNHAHDKYLYKEPPPPHTPHHQGDLSVIPTFETLCNLEKCPSQKNTDANDNTILNIMIWKQPIVKYQLLNWPKINNISMRPGTTTNFLILQHSLVYSLLLIINIFCVVLFCFVFCFPADSFNLVKLIIYILMNGITKLYSYCYTRSS